MTSNHIFIYRYRNLLNCHLSCYGTLTQGQVDVNLFIICNMALFEVMVFVWLHILMSNHCMWVGKQGIRSNESTSTLCCTGVQLGNDLSWRPWLSFFPGRGILWLMALSISTRITLHVSTLYQFIVIIVQYGQKRAVPEGMRARGYDSFQGTLK